MARHSRRQEPGERAHQQALRLLAVRPRSRAEMSERLAAAGLDQQVVEATVQRLLAAGLLDDAEFARTRARSLGRGKGWGPRRLRWDLQRRGIAAQIVEQAVAEAYGSEGRLAVMRALARRKFGPELLEGKAEPRQLARARRFLLQRGFEADDVEQLLEG